MLTQTDKARDLAERFGGYAASVTLGLLGFAQILWDKNRQGFHDKIVETVVIDAPKKAS